MPDCKLRAGYITNVPGILEAAFDVVEAAAGNPNLLASAHAGVLEAQAFSVFKTRHCAAIPGTAAAGGTTQHM